MSVNIEINDAGQAVLLIEDAAGEVHPYRLRLAPRGLALWAIKLTRADTDATYLIREETPGKWSCSCPGQMYRKRGADHCKHLRAMRTFRAWLNDFLSQPKPQPQEKPNGQRTVA